MPGPWGALTVMTADALLLSCESLPVSMSVWGPAALKVPEVTTGFTCPATSGNVEVGLPREAGHAPPVTLHLAVSVAPEGKPSSLTLRVSVVVRGRNPGVILTMLLAT